MMRPICALLMLTTATILFNHIVLLASARHIGVSYGLNGNNLPSPADVISLYKRCGIELIRLYEPNHEVLEALRGSELTVAIGPRNEDLQNIATSQEAANAWVNTHIGPYKNDVRFKWITLGNEVIPGPYATYVARAMNNTRNALISVGLPIGVRVTTVIHSGALASSYPPSAGAFVDNVTQVMQDVAYLAVHNAAPLMVNVYPYFAYASDPEQISSDYALFNSKEAVVTDGNLQYFNLFDAMVDAFNAALEKIGYGNVTVAVAETGWPSAGNSPYTSAEIAKMYNEKVLDHVMKNGTPRRPGNLMETFFFEMFNENMKAEGVEQNFGFFNPNMEPVYPFW